MPIECDALMLGSQQSAAHVSAHSPEADHSDLHVWCAPRVGLPELIPLGLRPRGSYLAVASGIMSAASARMPEARRRPFPAPESTAEPHRAWPASAARRSRLRQGK